MAGEIRVSAQVAKTNRLPANKTSIETSTCVEDLIDSYGRTRCATLSPRWRCRYESRGDVSEGYWIGPRP